MELQPSEANKMVPQSSQANQALDMPAPGEGVAPTQPRPKTVEEKLQEAQRRIEELTASLSERAAFEKVLNTRRRIGYGTGFVGVVSLGGLGYFSFATLHSIVNDAIAKLQPSFFWALVVGHALITVALVYLCYQIIRASERLMLPYWWVERHPDTAKAMLGVTDPVSSATKVAEQLVDAAGKVAGAAANAAKVQKP